MAEGRERHCWECLRRRLVCDFQQPGCKRCAASEVECPGYGETPPMRVKWLAPGKVKSRQRKCTSNHQQHCKDSSTSTTLPATSSEISRKSSGFSSTDSTTSDDTQHEESPRLHLKTDYHALIDSVEYCMGTSSYNPRRTIKRLTIMTVNSCMYPQLADSLRLGTNANIYKLSPNIFQLGLTRPAHLQLSLICLTLSHRINQLSHDMSSRPLKPTFYRYRGLVIRSLNEDINTPNKGNGDIVLAGILTLLLVDVR